MNEVKPEVNLESEAVTNMTAAKAQLIHDDAVANKADSNAIPIAGIISLILSIISNLKLCAPTPAQGHAIMTNPDAAHQRRLNRLVRRNLRQQHLAPTVQASVVKVASSLTLVEVDQLYAEEDV